MLPKLFEKTEILRNLDLSHDNVIEASAGTGKTYTIEHLVVELILGKNPFAPQQLPLSIRDILLVTFTEKAAGELKQRVRAKIRRLMFEGSSITESEAEKTYWNISAEQQQILLKAFLDFESIGVYTIHGFCNRLLREFAFENGQLFEQEQMSNSVILPEVFRRLLRTHLVHTIPHLLQLYLEKNTLADLETELLAIVGQQGTLMPQLVDFSKLSSTVQPLCDDFLAQLPASSEQQTLVDLSPVEQAFHQMNLNAQSFKSLLPHLQRLLQALVEYHHQHHVAKLLSRLLEIDFRKILTLKFNKTAKAGKIYQSVEELPQTVQAFLKVMRLLQDVFAANPLGIALTVVDQLLQMEPQEDQVATIKEQMNADKWVRILLLLKIIPSLRNEMSQYKEENGYFDFDDMLLRVEESVKESEQFTKAIRQKYKYALIDEFQDTDPIQWNIFRKLFLDSPHHKLMVIGDPKQAIYSFRGGDVWAYLQAKRTITEKSGQAVMTLSKNFRSSPDIIAGLNQIFAHSTLFKGEINFQPVECGKEYKQCLDSSGTQAIHLFQIQPAFFITSAFLTKEIGRKAKRLPDNLLHALQELKDQTFIGEASLIQAVEQILPEPPAETYTLLTERAHGLNAQMVKETFAIQIAEEIHRLLMASLSEFALLDETGIPTQIQSRDICVLFRSKNEGNLLAQALRLRGVPYAFYKQSGLFQTKEAQEIYHLLVAIHEPSRSNCSKAWLTRFFNIPLEELEHYTEVQSDHLYMQQLSRWHYLAQQGKFSQLFESILQESEVFPRELFLNGGEREITNYDHILEVLARYVSDRHLDLQELLYVLKSLIEGSAHPGESENLLRLEGEQQAVQLMTMHASKGLEFPVVFIFGGFTRTEALTKFYTYHQTDERIIDLGKENKNAYLAEQAQEDQRLLYVAFTRAKARLYLPYVPRFDMSSNAKRIYSVNGSYGETLSSLDDIVAHLPQHISFSLSEVVPRLESLSEPEPSSTQWSQLLSQWEPTLPIESPNQLLVDDLKQRCKAFTVSSYTRLTRQQSAETEVRLQDTSQPEKAAAEEDMSLDSLARDVELPGGATTGTFLHELLETAETKVLQSQTDWARWSALPPTQQWVENLLDKYGFPHRYDTPSTQIVWDSFKKPLPIQSHSAPHIAPLCRASRSVREMEFFFPIPETDHPQLHQLVPQEDPPKTWKIDRGFLNGSIDFIFEQEGVTYFIDWKSNVLPNYKTESTETVVDSKYALQWKIYTIAVVRWLSIQDEQDYNQRFGGFMYVFLRGLSRNQGVFFKKPQWEELLHYERELREQTY